jgi:NADPH-dependent 2,4-dienoyl-CoA reductase/sulfur reductase-like enzyme
VLERASEPGGQILLSRLVPGRADLAGLAAYLAGAATRAGAVIHLGVEATVDAVLARRPDMVVVATGARPGIPFIPGIADSPAVDAFTVLARPAGRVRRALVIGGGMLGVGVAHVLAERGVEVVVVEPGGELAAELGVRPRWQHVADLRARENVTILLGATVEALYPDGALVRRGGEEIKLRDLDLVVPTRPMVPAGELGEALTALPDGPPVFEIGDCSVPRTAFEAMQEAAALGHRL